MELSRHQTELIYAALNEEATRARFLELLHGEDHDDWAAHETNPATPTPIRFAAPAPISSTR